MTDISFPVIKRICAVLYNGYIDMGRGTGHPSDQKYTNIQCFVRNPNDTNANLHNPLPVPGVFLPTHPLDRPALDSDDIEHDIKEQS